eukprot:181353_1
MPNCTSYPVDNPNLCPNTCKCIDANGATHNILTNNSGSKVGTSCLYDLCNCNGGRSCQKLSKEYPDIPDKFDGKTCEQVLNTGSHIELTKFFNHIKTPECYNAAETSHVCCNRAASKRPNIFRSAITI